MRITGLLIALFAVLLVGCGESRVDFHGKDITGVMEDLSFTLTDENGDTVTESIVDGKAVVLFFGYTHCPDICPAVLARVAQVYRQLQEAGEADQVQPVFITFDPERDTAEHLNEYLPWFKADIIGLTGSLAEIREVATQYGVVFIKDQEEQDYLFTHSDYIYLLDDQGRVRKLYPADFTIDEVVTDAKSLL